MSHPNDQSNPAAAIPVYVAAAPAGSGVGIAPVTSTAAESSHVLKASPGALYSLTVTTDSTSGWLMLFDATSAPADGAVTPAYMFPIAGASAPGAGAALSWPQPLKFSTGIVAVFSSTGPFTKTAAATATFSAQVV